MTSNDPFGDPDPLWSWASNGHPTFGIGETADFANWIGRVVVGYSAIEFQFYMILAVLSESHPTDTFREFYGARAIQVKEQLFTDHLLRLPPDYRNCLVSLWRRMRGAATRRTVIAHCALMKRGDSYLRLQLVGKKAFVAKMDKGLFAKTIRQYRTLQTDVHIFLVYLGFLEPERYLQKLAQLPVPRGSRRLDLEDDPGPLPQHVEDERIASVNRLGLGKVLMIDQARYPRPRDYYLSFQGNSIVWREP